MLALEKRIAAKRDEIVKAKRELKKLEEEHKQAQLRDELKPIIDVAQLIEKYGDREIQTYNSGFFQNWLHLKLFDGETGLSVEITGFHNKYYKGPIRGLKNVKLSVKVNNIHINDHTIV
ncbi:MAG: hypothetical protein Faunusvirus48_2 [Faunusvirus sp.]|jgi:hypothetical protein|uniref:Uncharacterized protein n=1 Tax=Faunusvirus sp. TaxID=2487766 RepID=A0A3G4ZXW7_9VIRU|nr:MAG: hypothetical protein Faunusvirus48_2 [Faunusvirus sp.]